MASEIEVRVEKFNNLKNAGKNPFEITKFDQTHHTDEAKALYDELEAQLLGTFERNIKAKAKVCPPVSVDVLWANGLHARSFVVEHRSSQGILR